MKLAPTYYFTIPITDLANYIPIPIIVTTQLVMMCNLFF